ncbi:MAG TPA: S9 family peptidase [Thermoanaerobaculia bacterium]|nr:S9 family peptidase [Thermoanaerobaculia bacterium]
MLTAVLLAAALQSSDLYKLRSVAEVAISPDGKLVAYSVERNEPKGRPARRLSILDIASGTSKELPDRTAGAVWSPDGEWLAFNGPDGLQLAKKDGSGIVTVGKTEGTNSPLQLQGATVAWSPDGRTIAYVSSTPGPETDEVSGDPVVLRRFLYKPDLAEGNTRLNDNRRLHIFLYDVATKQTRQLTSGHHYEHSIAWSPDGSELAFVSNRDEDEDQFFNYDLFAVRVKDGEIRRITATESAEYQPRYSPDGKSLLFLGTRRGLTDLETTMEDTHVWTVEADGSNRREVGKDVDNRQLAASWSADGRQIYFTLQERGNTRLMRMPATGGKAERLVDGEGRVNAYSVAKTGRIAYALATPDDLAQLYVDGKRLTAPNEMAAAKTESFRFLSNDHKFEVEAFLTRPLGMTATSKHPLIVVIHGGPHGQQGSLFTFRHQVYAARGWAVLQVNYRGSTGYGQAFADAVFRDQNGDEAQDVLYGVNAALRRYPWIDRNRLGVEGVSYGGQLSAWLITQTRIFKAAIPTAAIINLVSYNYTTYYNQYEEMEYGYRPHQLEVMDELWARSPLRYVARAATPTLLIHGENDNDVPIAEAEQFYVALKDVGVETVFVRYPREGHGIREPKHVIDWLDRSIAWYEAHFRAE